MRYAIAAANGTTPLPAALHRSIRWAIPSASPITTIAYRAGVMAADTRAYSGGNHPVGEKIKIHRLSDGSLFGASASKIGEPDRFRRMVDEMGVEADFGDDIPVQALVVNPKGEVYYFNDQRAFSGPISVEFIAIGSGEQSAHAAMLMGADARRAIEIAIQCDPWTGGEITTLEGDGHGEDVGEGNPSPQIDCHGDA